MRRWNPILGQKILLDAVFAEINHDSSAAERRGRGIRRTSTEGTNHERITA
jgi:hypothetical protein